LQPLVLKRLLDAFPKHVGAYARREGRIVRLYFQYVGADGNGNVHGTLINAGNGPAIDIKCGCNYAGVSHEVRQQGGLSIGSPLQTTSSENQFAPSITFACHDNLSGTLIWCEYSNVLGDRFRVEVPLYWRGGCYAPHGGERFFGRVADQWQLIA
jgi:hypothetical protein